jgi:GT2 family glycosyltransferase
VVNHKDHPEFRGGLSRARNFGIEQAVGDVIGFPDDDVWYGPDLLESVSTALKDPENDGVSFRVVDENGICSAGWMSSGKKDVSRRNVWHTAVSVSLFIKRSIVGSVRFDGGLGVGSGTRFGSGEETDFVLRLIENGAKIIYDGSKCVYHPQSSGGEKFQKGWLYGNGYGFVLRKHKYSVFRLVWGVGVQFVRAVQSVLRLRFKKSAYHIAMSVGRFSGYFR